MSWLKRKNKLEQLRASGLIAEALDPARQEGRSEDEGSPAGPYERVCTSAGKAAHLRHPVRGVLCSDMHDWPASAWLPAPAEMPLHRRCELAARAADGERAAS